MGVAAERPLEDPAVARPVEDRAPQLQLADPVGRLLGVELGHPRVVEELAADHRVAEVDLPRVAAATCAERRRDAALGHHRVGLAEQRLADEPDGRARRPRSIAARSPAPPAPMTRTSCGWVSRRARHRRRLEADRRVGDDPEREQADVDVGERDREQARPGPRHVVAVQRVSRCQSV